METSNNNVLSAGSLREPATDKRKQLSTTLSAEQKKLKDLSNQLKDLKVRVEPQEPKFDSSNISLVATIAAAIVVVLFILHCIIWVLNLIFDIEWDTWGWTVTAFWWGLCTTVFVVAATTVWYIYQKRSYDEKLTAYHEYLRTKGNLENGIKDANTAINNKMTEIVGSLNNDVKEIIEVPLSLYAIQFKDKEEVEKLLKEYYDLKNKMLNVGDPVEKAKLHDELTNKKLAFFYKYSIKGETNVTYPFFKKQLEAAQSQNNYNVLRIEKSNQTALSHLNKLNSYTKLLKENKMTPILNDLNDIKDIDTTGWFGRENVDALAEKTGMLQELFKAAKYEYKELASVNKDISYLLEYVRVCAYRNIYLGAELLNYIRDNAGGKSLTTEKGMVDMNVKLENISISVDSLKMDVIGNITATVSNTIQAGVELLDNKDVRKFVGKNPKASAGIAAAALIGSAISNYTEERNAKIKQNNKIQKDAIKNIQKMVDNYTKGQGALLRAIELIKAITKANSGFMQVYEPLKKQVFDNNAASSVTMQDIRQLAIATNEYNKISQAKL